MHYPQLPVSSYFDPVIFEAEKELLFAGGPKYVGHALQVPNVGDYYALPQENEARALIRTEKGVELVSNICRHRQAIMLKGNGNLGELKPGSAGGHIVCPLHRWTYSGGGSGAKTPVGTLLGAPNFTHDPCAHLKRYPLREWNGLLFEDNGRDVSADLSKLGLALINFDDMVLGHVELHECNYNWKTFVEVYLEDYHVEPFHPGLGNFVKCADLRWEFDEECSVQTVGAKNLLGKAGSPVYQKWQQQLMQYRGDVPPETGALWLTYYPNIMVEWYPHVLTVSTLYPMAVDKTLNKVEFFYPSDIVAFEPGFMAAQRDAYMETCVEDDDIAERMDAGRKALNQRGESDGGPYQNPMEEGMKHFHYWYRDKMKNLID